VEAKRRGRSPVRRHLIETIDGEDPARGFLADVGSAANGFGGMHDGSGRPARLGTARFFVEYLQFRAESRLGRRGRRAAVVRHLRAVH
jgi:hypothetical protein